MVALDELDIHQVKEDDTMENSSCPNNNDESPMSEDEENDAAGTDGTDDTEILEENDDSTVHCVLEYDNLGNVITETVVTADHDYYLLNLLSHLLPHTGQKDQQIQQ